MEKLPQFNNNEIEKSHEVDMDVERKRWEDNNKALEDNLAAYDNYHNTDPSLKEKILGKLLHPLNLPALGGMLVAIAEIPQEDLEKAGAALAIGLATTALLRLANVVWNSDPSPAYYDHGELQNSGIVKSLYKRKKPELMNQEENS